MNTPIDWFLKNGIGAHLSECITLWQELINFTWQTHRWILDAVVGFILQHDAWLNLDEVDIVLTHQHCYSIERCSLEHCPVFKTAHFSPTSFSHLTLGWTGWCALPEFRWVYFILECCFHACYNWLQDCIQLLLFFFSQSTASYCLFSWKKKWILYASLTSLYSFQSILACTCHIGDSLAPRSLLSAPAVICNIPLATPGPPGRNTALY